MAASKLWGGRQDEPQVGGIMILVKNRTRKTSVDLACGGRFDARHTCKAAAARALYSTDVHGRNVPFRIA